MDKWDYFLRDKEYLKVRIYGFNLRKRLNNIDKYTASYSAFEIIVNYNRSIQYLTTSDLSCTAELSKLEILRGQGYVSVIKKQKTY